MIEQKRVNDVEVGDYVEEAYDANRKLLLSEFPVHDKEDLERLNDIGAKRCIVRSKSTADKGPDADPQTPPVQDEAEAEETTGRGVVRRAQVTYRRTLEKLENLVRTVHDDREQAYKLRELRPLLDLFFDFMTISPPSISCLIQLQQFDSFTYHHSLNVGLLALLYGHQEGFEQNELMEFGFGALVHDIGKTDLSRRIIKKTSNLTEKERSIVHKHPEKGRTILKNTGFSETIQKIALQHHRRPDGSGYPSSSEEIHPLARVVSVLDRYEHLTNRRDTEDGVDPHEAYFDLKQTFGDHEKTRIILETLVDCMGLFPIGSLVELSNQDVGVVIDNNSDELKYPTVTILGSRNSGAYEEHFEINLEELQHQKKAVGDMIYDDSIEVKRLLDYSDTPNLRSQIPALVEQYHVA